MKPKKPSGSQNRKRKIVIQESTSRIRGALDKFVTKLTDNSTNSHNVIDMAVGESSNQNVSKCSSSCPVVNEGKIRSESRQLLLICCQLSQF